MTISDEKLSAYFDGELPEAEMAEIAAMVEDEPEVAARLEALALQDARLKDGFREIDERPIRADTMALLDAFAQEEKEAPTDTVSGEVVSLADRRSRGRFQAPMVSWGHAIAASVALVVGIGLGAQFPANDGNSRLDVFANANIVDESNPLFAVLEATPSAETALLGSSDQVAVTPVLSFRDKTGSFCRDYEVRAQTGTSRNVACKREQAWVVQLAMAAVSATASNETGYSPASATMSGVYDEALLDMIVGDALSAEEEAALIGMHWQNR